MSKHYIVTLIYFQSAYYILSVKCLTELTFELPVLADCFAFSLVSVASPELSSESFCTWVSPVSLLKRNVPHFLESNSIHSS